ncbi:MAG: hypothetical protein C4576_11445 [Desulfobacteraceae bacterium]|nr:MAG: hypothetical protein C4576_11445 [Desulfobacteraceae bacterium]
MRARVNPEWIGKIKNAIKEVADPEERPKIDETLSFNAAAQWLITFLSNRNIPFKVVQLGAGVKRITTDTDTCPFCKKKLEA